MAKAYNKLTEKLDSRRDNFDEIFQMFNASLFHEANNNEYLVGIKTLTIISNF